MSPRLRLGVLCSHPIQYNAPLFRELAQLVDLHVYYAHRQTAAGQAEAGFGVAFEWDSDLFSGYSHEFLDNISSKPGVGHFFGCDTPAIVNRIRDGRFDAFLVTGWYLKSYWQGIRACRRLGIPVLVRGDSRLATSRSPLKRMTKQALYPQLLKQFAACLYVGQDSREYYAHYGVPDARLFFAPHCVDNDWFASQALGISKNQARRESGIPDDGSDILLFVGKLIDIKRPTDIVQAAAVIRDAGRKVSLLYVGDGPLRAQIEAEAARLAVPVMFLGFRNQSELPTLFRAADLLVLPSESETWGLAVNEAMACGTPAVVADSVGCAADLLPPGSVYPKGDIAEMARVLLAALDTPVVPAFLVEKMQRYSVPVAARGVREAALWVSNAKATRS